MGGHLFDSNISRNQDKVHCPGLGHPELAPQGLSVSSSPCSTLNRVKQEQCGKVMKVPGDLCTQERGDCGGLLWPALEDALVPW